MNATKKYSVGSLSYTPQGLFVLFSWLLWGDFIFQLMEQVMPVLLPLTLRTYHISNTSIGFITTTIGMWANSICNPIVSSVSDRYRSRMGRRRPFILWSTPFLVLALCAIPFIPDIVTFIGRFPAVVAFCERHQWSVLIIVASILVGMFQILNMFVSTTYFYLVADVVPNEFIGRFYSFFRLFSQAAVICWNLVFLPMTDKSHACFMPIFVGIALTYGVFIMIMCWRVNEGEYPPRPPKKPFNPVRIVKTYFVECFSHPFFWLVFMTWGFLLWGNASGVFGLFFCTEQLEMTKGQFGFMLAFGAIIMMILVVPLGYLADKLGSHRAMLIGVVLAALIRLCAVFMVQDAHSQTLWYVLGLPASFMVGVSVNKWLIDLYPASRYGQFSSAGALVMSLTGGFLATLFGRLADTNGYDYRFCLTFPAFCTLAMIPLVAIIWRQWRAIGGPKDYQAKMNARMIMLEKEDSAAVVESLSGGGCQPALATWRDGLLSGGVILLLIASAGIYGIICLHTSARIWTPKTYNKLVAIEHQAPGQDKDKALDAILVEAGESKARSDLPPWLKKTIHFMTGSTGGSVANSNPMIQAGLAMGYLEGQGVPRDVAAALRWAQAAADTNKNLAAGEYALGLVYLKAPAPVGDLAQGFRHMKAAAKAKYPPAQFMLSELYAEGTGTVADEKAVVASLEAAVEMGYVPALTQLGQWTLEGKAGVKQDVRRGLELLSRAARRGEWTAQDILVALNINGMPGVPADPKEAARWMRIGVEHGNRAACEALAKAYRTGSGVNRSDAEAVRLEAMAEAMRNNARIQTW